MAKAKTSEAKPGVIERVKIFTRDVQVEMKKVTWPSKEDLKTSTKVCMFMLLLMAGITFGFDKIFEVIILQLLQLAG
jgi:preprotein translocase subunit SecE